MQTSYSDYRGIGGSVRCFKNEYVASPEDYASYEKYFVDQLPYTDDELKEMATLDIEALKEKAASLSIEDAAARSGK